MRSTNPIESTFATVRHRTIRSKGCLSNKTALAMVYKLTDAAQKSWRRLDDPNQLPKLIQGVKFTDGVEVISPQTQAAARPPPSPTFGDNSTASGLEYARRSSDINFCNRIRRFLFADVCGVEAVSLGGWEGATRADGYLTIQLDRRL
jgi:hypothetical protein